MKDTDRKDTERKDTDRKDSDPKDTDPVKFRVTHRTKYHYDELVPLSHNVVHLHPRDTDRQQCEQCEISIFPGPAWRQDRIDVFGNHVAHFCLQEPHRSLTIVARSDVEVTPFDPKAVRDSSWDAVPDLLKRPGDVAALHAREFTFASPRIPCSPLLAQYARADFPSGRSLMEATTALMQRIHKEFIFDSRATTISTPVLEVLDHRKGVCQDFAHLQIGCLRSLGLAARYVSGYLLTKPPPGKPRLIGCDVSHAWLSVYFPKYGWVDFDPTGGVLPTGHHVTLAFARDYDDITPVKGVIIGGHRHMLSVAVDVIPFDELPTAPPIAAPAVAAPTNGTPPVAAATK
jgi:transglutaminase-like putative cysteine protease